MLKYLKPVLCLLAITVICTACTSVKTNPENNIIDSQTSPRPEDPAGMPYDLYFSEERALANDELMEDWVYKVDENSRLYRIPAKLDSQGVLIDEQDDREYLQENVWVAVPMKNGWVYCIAADRMQFFRVDLEGNHRAELATAEEPVEGVSMHLEVIFFYSSNTLFRYHIYSGVIDRGYTEALPITSLWYRTNYQIAYGVTRKEPIQMPDGDESSVSMHIYNFETNEMITRD